MTFVCPRHPSIQRIPTQTFRHQNSRRQESTIINCATLFCMQRKNWLRAETKNNLCQQAHNCKGKCEFLCRCTHTCHLTVKISKLNVYNAARKRCKRRKNYSERHQHSCAITQCLVIGALFSSLSRFPYFYFRCVSRDSCAPAVCGVAGRLQSRHSRERSLEGKCVANAFLCFFLCTKYEFCCSAKMKKLSTMCLNSGFRLFLCVIRT